MSASACWREQSHVATGWQVVVSNFIPSNIYVVTDTVRGIIAVTFDVVLVMDGRGLVPITPACTFEGTNLFEFHVNAEKKVTHFRGVWDPLNPKMGAAFGAVMMYMHATGFAPPPTVQSVVVLPSLTPYTRLVVHVAGSSATV